MTTEQPMTVQQVLASNMLDHPSASMPGMVEFGSDVPDDVTDVHAMVDRILADERLHVTLSNPDDGARELVDHLNGMMDSLDDSVSHDQIYDQLLLAWNMARDLRPRGIIAPTVDEWAEQMDAERARQIEHGYDDAHDAQHGTAHLLNWAIDYARRGNNLAAATMARCALPMPRGTVTDAEVEAAARAYAGDEMSAAEWEWVKTQPHLAEPYLTGMRAALEAAREARS